MTKREKVSLIRKVIRERMGRLSIEVGSKIYADETTSFDCSDKMVEKHGEYDLFDCWPLADMKADDFPQDGEIDLYLYSIGGRYTERELETNVTVVFEGGSVAKVYGAYWIFERAAAGERVLWQAGS